MENKVFEISGLQILKGDTFEGYIRSADLILAQQDRRLRIATATIQEQRQMIDALQRRLARLEVLGKELEDKVNALGDSDAPVIDVTDVPQEITE